MKTQFYICQVDKPTYDHRYYLCKDGKFILGFVTGMGKKDTVAYKRLNHALKVAARHNCFVVTFSENGDVIFV